LREKIRGATPFRMTPRVKPHFEESFFGNRGQGRNARKSLFNLYIKRRRDSAKTEGRHGRSPHGFGRGKRNLIPGRCSKCSCAKKKLERRHKAQSLEKSQPRGHDCQLYEWSQGEKYLPSSRTKRGRAEFVQCDHEKKRNSSYGNQKTP